LLAALFRDDARESHVLEHRERRVHGAWARCVRSAEAALELLDDLVAVARFLLEKAENDVLEVALLEHASAAAAPMPSAPGSSPIAKRVPPPAATPVPA